MKVLNIIDSERKRFKIPIRKNSRRFFKAHEIGTVIRVLGDHKDAWNRQPEVMKQNILDDVYINSFKIKKEGKIYLALMIFSAKSGIGSWGSSISWEIKKLRKKKLLSRGRS